MTRYLLWDAAPGEIRLMFHTGGKLRELRLLRLLDRDIPVLPGSTMEVRLGAKLGPRRALVHYQSGEGEISPIPDCTEGSWLTAEMVRAPLPEPGRWKRAVFRPAFATKPLTIADFVHGQWPDLTAVVCIDPIEADQIRKIMADKCPDIVIDAEAIADADIASWCERAITGEFVIDGGLLTIERSRAMMMIDIDGYQDAHKVNLAAARTIPWLLQLYGVGGQVGIDFLGSANKAQRAEIDATLARACTALPQHERTAVNGFGFVQMVLPRPGPSVIEALCGTGWKTPSVETQALMLLRDAARSQGVGVRELVARDAILTQVRRWPGLLGKLQAQLGCAVGFRCDPTQTGYGHVHVCP